MDDLMHSLRLLKMFNEIGLYEAVAGDIDKLRDGQYYELIMYGFENVAHSYEMVELDEDVCCGGHVVHHFSDPAIPEYYRLCRLYEYRHELTPSENPYVKKADDYFFKRCKNTRGDFAAGFNDEVHIREILVEICPEWYANEAEIICLVLDVMNFYRSEVEAVRDELLSGPVIFLPALPEHHAQTKKKRRKAADKSLQKAG